MTHEFDHHKDNEFLAEWSRRLETLALSVQFSKACKISPINAVRPSVQISNFDHKNQLLDLDRKAKGRSMQWAFQQFQLCFRIVFWAVCVQCEAPPICLLVSWVTLKDLMCATKAQHASWKFGPDTANQKLWWKGVGILPVCSATVGCLKCCQQSMQLRSNLFNEEKLILCLKFSYLGKGSWWSLLMMVWGFPLTCN